MAKKKKRQAISDISKKQTLKLGIKKRKKIDKIYKLISKIDKVDPLTNDVDEVMNNLLFLFLRFVQKKIQRYPCPSKALKHITRSIHGQGYREL